MGIDLFLDKKPCDLERITTIRSSMALLRWVEENVLKEGMSMSSKIILEQEHLEDLMATLNKLTPKNCQDLFFDELYSKKDHRKPKSEYWEMVANLKVTVSELLESFDFENYCVEFSAWW
jgi:hypothetical protein